MTNFCEALTLLEYNREKGPVVIEVHPQNYEFNKEKESIFICSFPEQTEKNIIFSFTVKKFLCYIWSFVLNEKIYSITILSRVTMPSFYLDFLKQCQDKFKELEPSVRFKFIKDLIFKWDYTKNFQTIKFSFPNKDFEVQTSDLRLPFCNFDPTVNIGKDTILLRIWKALITNQSILFIGNNPTQLSNAVFSALSMITPFKFIDYYIIFTRLGDPRFADVINGSKRWRIVGTTNSLASERCSQFQVVIKLSDKPNPSNQDTLNFVRKRSNKLAEKSEMHLNYMLESDPYSDILNHFDMNKDFARCIRRIDLSENEYTNFAHSSMFWEWRRPLIYRESFREAILSFIPDDVVSKHSNDDLAIVEKSLAGYYDHIRGDDHLKAVLALHLKLIRKRIHQQK
ncbi:hypothetical protein TVAG_125680 [Trichomonas vaginalis G3]|uniref:UDENN domain-containing protein n=1 Tax=Trichomonas vaginalis (strain ATCC PRA-98 / G3) TaxID=412133 RepID=A2ET75_TRIV3|nr:UDENN domain family [Trichomonas vaginalis G3]EAY04128.1 hypothetical protein TVAG_125680 [Trichomonas vaginalis G3]KAI5549861.1 UDENN domain family [Trichomonas vaginalis G3]|eukprot:XP_001316351.1 hypothetical protein [Trichomonas vaginalis G3]